MNLQLRQIRIGRGAAFLVLLLSMMCAPCVVRAQGRTEYRAFWVDTFNTNLNNHADVLAVVNNARAARANALFVQVRRRGDSWYLNSLEPRGDRTPIQPGFDPLQDIINEAHAQGIEVHAFVIMSAVWGRAPNLFPPENPNHVFNLHGGFNAATNTITPGANNWLTRTLLPDGGTITYQGHRIGSDFWIDFGHPAAAAYTVEVLNHLVRNYDIDGLHLDRIRYPELGVTGQTPTTGANIGYNPTSVERFQKHHNIAPGTAAPAPGNPQWSQWRRDQVTNVVRRVYLNALSIKPDLKVSAALIAFGGIGASEAAWNSAEANWRVYQDWRAWTEEGIIDIAIPMVYKAEHTATVRPQYDQWDAWLRGHLYNRAGMMGQGAANNAIEGTLRQTRRTLTPASGATNLSGIVYFSMATSNIAVANNPFALLSPASTAARSFAEFASGLTTGKSTSGATLYEPAGLTPIFGDAAQIPAFPWKVAPTLGHFKGEARAADDTPLDTAPVTIENLDTHATRTATTDGGGFFGAVDLTPGSYRARAGASYFCFNVAPGLVAEAERDTLAPATDAAVTPSAPGGQNGWYTASVAVTLDATDNCAGVAATEYSTDGGQTWQPYAGAFTVGDEGAHTILYRSTDRANNTETAKELLLKIDKTAPSVTLSATPSVIWPANNQTIDATIAGSASDSVSGLAGVSYVVTDEYGTPLGITPRSLSGTSTQWQDSLALEARRNGQDRNGRLYRIIATITDQAGNTTTASTDIIVPHDQRTH
jgi:uncharacterized lipoprotein YddW (UPF0748 family)